MTGSAESVYGRWKHTLTVSVSLRVSTVLETETDSAELSAGNRSDTLTRQSLPSRRAGDTPVKSEYANRRRIDGAVQNMQF